MASQHLAHLRTRVCGPGNRPAPLRAPEGSTSGRSIDPVFPDGGGQNSVPVTVQRRRLRGQFHHSVQRISRHGRGLRLPADPRHGLDRRRCRAATRLFPFRSGPRGRPAGRSTARPGQRPPCEVLLSRYGAALTSAFALLTVFWLLALLVIPSFQHCSASRSGPICPVDTVGGPNDVYSPRATTQIPQPAYRARSRYSAGPSTSRSTWQLFGTVFYSRRS